MRQNNSEFDDFEQSRIEYTNYLKERGYNESLIEDAFNKLKNININPGGV